MKKAIVFLGVLLFSINAFAQRVPMGQQEQAVNIPCDNASDCALRVQYETDLTALLTAQQAVNAAQQTYNNAQNTVQTDINNYQIPSTQANLSAQLSKDQANLATFKSGSVSTTTSVTTGAITAN